jgi:uracil-DNA glycosylase
MSRRLSALSAEICACRICKDRPQGKPLAHEPHPVFRVSASARIGIFGQAPGTRVHASGMPFTDPSGVRLRQWMGVGDEEFYDQTRVAIVPMGFCFPGLDAKGGDLPPRPECAPAWRMKLLAELPRLEVVLLVGGYAQAWHLGGNSGATLTETVERWKTISKRKGTPRYWPLPHPSWRNNGWLKKNPWFEAELVPALRQDVGRALRAP